MSNIDRAAVLSWFTGKALVNMTEALDALDRSIAQGFWEKGWSRKVRAAATKATKAISYGRKARRLKLFPELNYKLEHYEEISAAKYLVEWMIHGHVRASDVAKVKSEDHLSLAQRLAVDTARKFSEELEPVYAAMERLDATRPKAVFTSIGLSPTVTRTLAGLGIETNGAKFTIECPEMKTEEIETVDAKGKKSYRTVITIVWPEGCRHHSSRFPMMAGTNYLQCESCGHAIRNAFNWVPLLVQVEGQPARSMWVGRDCAEKLFGFKIEGEIEIANRPGL
jgi:hypothetical protein